VWYVRYREDSITPEGQVKRMYRNYVLGTKEDYPTQRLAQNALHDQLSTINSPNYRAKPTITFGEFADKWQKTVLPQHKPSTQTAVKSQLRKHLIPHFGGLQLGSITSETIQGFISSGHCAPKTARNLIASLRMIWNAGKAWGYVAGDPTEGLVLPKRGLVEVPSLSVDQIGSIVKNAEEPYRTFYLILAETGIRGGEICGLRLNDVDLQNGVIWVRQSVWGGKVQTVKSKKGNRRFPISPEMVEHLKGFVAMYWKSNPLGLLFATSTGTPWLHDMVRKRHFHPLLDRLGIPQCGFHAFRHGNATLLDQLNVPMAVRQNRLGHTDPKTTMEYTSVVSEDERKTAAELGRILHRFAPKPVVALSASAW
jgi:integrase